MLLEMQNEIKQFQLILIPNEVFKNKNSIELLVHLFNPFSPSVLYKGRQLLLPSSYTECHYF